jgi:hypothetical protein
VQLGIGISLGKPILQSSNGIAYVMHILLFLCHLRGNPGALTWITRQSLPNRTAPITGTRNKNHLVSACGHARIALMFMQHCLHAALAEAKRGKIQ